MEAYCVKCKKKVEVKDPAEAKAKNGRNMIKGVCSVCDTKVSKFVASK